MRSVAVVVEPVLAARALEARQSALPQPGSSATSTNPSPIVVEAVVAHARWRRLVGVEQARAADILGVVEGEIAVVVGAVVARQARRALARVRGAVAARRRGSRPVRRCRCRDRRCRLPLRRNRARPCSLDRPVVEQAVSVVVEAVRAGTHDHHVDPSVRRDENSRPGGGSTRKRPSTPWKVPRTRSEPSASASKCRAIESNAIGVEALEARHGRPVRRSRCRRSRRCLRRARSPRRSPLMRRADSAATRSS